MADYYRRNQAHLAPWDPPRPEGFFTPAWWEERLAQNLTEYAEDLSLRLFIRRREDPEGAVLGSASFSQFFRGPFRSCMLGYNVDAGCEGQGLMFEALDAAVRHVFETLAFHRVQANYLPHNRRSGRLLTRLGFRVEGYARNYLFIDGAWRDHVLTARTHDP